jgi:RNA polymerase sigma-70 factor, ECF subfamily
MPLGDLKSDAELIKSLQKGNQQALGSLYDRYKQKVYQTALAITGDPDAAADILQDVFLRLFRYSNTVDPSRPLDPWLYRVAANLCYTWMKSRQRWFHPLEDIVDWLSRSEDGSPIQVIGIDDDWLQVQKSLSTLPVAQRMVVVLYYLNDLSIEEISAALNVPIGTVKSRLHYGREALKKRLLLETQGEVFSNLGCEFT